MKTMHNYILPANAVYYRTLGPWSAEEIPEGLKGQHQLKTGSWAVIKILRGTIDFAWVDEATESALTLESGMELTVPPQVLHHLVLTGPVELALYFHRESPAA